MVIEATNIKKSLTELNYIINNMDESFSKKIPKELQDAIYDSMDKEYIFEVDIEKDYTQQEFLPETKALLSIIISDYIGDLKIKQKWKEFDEKYSEVMLKNFEIEFKNQTLKKNIYEDNIKKVDTSKVMIEYKETFIKKIICKIKNIFRKK